MVLRVRTFEHIHDLSIAEQTEEKRGVFVARVTADVDTLSQFTEWGGIAWIISFALVFGALALMLVYSWQLTIAVVLLVIPLLWVVSSLQGRLTQAFDLVRTRVGQLMSEVSESVMGAAVVRAYGLEDRTDLRVKRAIDERYRATIVAHWRSATLFPIATFFYAVAVSVIVWLGATHGPGWGLTFGRVSAFIFLSDVFLHVFTDLPEIYADTQTAIAGWRKILTVLDLPVEIVEPEDGVDLPSGPDRCPNERAASTRTAKADVCSAASRSRWTADAHVAIVGQTGGGKTTFAKLLARLADPASGDIEVDGVDLRRVSPVSRRAAIRMVPQDGFLFDTTVRENVRYGRPDASDRDVETAFEELGLADWVDALPQGLDTPVGERGEALSVGERQLVSLARAQIDQPGLLILDEATSAVDPATERRTTEALRRLSAGRTVDHDRAPALDRRARGSRAGPRRRTAGRGGNARRAPRARRGVRGAARELARQHARGARGLRGPIGFRAAMSDFVEQLREVAAASLLPESGELTVPGLAEPVEILRDHWGVPVHQRRVPRRSLVRPGIRHGR